MSVESKKTLWMLLAGVGALVGAALIYHYATGDDDNSGSVSNEEIKEALKAARIGEPKTIANGALLENRYFLEILQFIGV